ncbi:heterokaryon incompatibility protein [Rutstroemia sp. NJR-2017a BBW]|nr:heterokaryon incompatibility protein [Rutstroemia sp. NJR-2017a BBW]
MHKSIRQLGENKAAKEVIVYLGEVLHHGSIAPKKATSTTTTFHGDDRDSQKLSVFLNGCKETTSSTACKVRQRLDYAFEIFNFLRLLAGKPNLELLSIFNLSSRQGFDTKYQESLFEGLRQMMLCLWWKRIWVVQEVVVPKNITMVYGSSVAPWTMFVDAADWISISSTASFTFPQEFSTVLDYFSRIVLDIERMRFHCKITQGQGRLGDSPVQFRGDDSTPLLRLLRRFGDRKASDDRDKVYALLSLARNRRSILPDYTVGVREVYIATTLDIITGTGSLAVLTGDLGRKDRQDLPSWVTDWSASYDDRNRRRAEDRGVYDATEGCLLYLVSEETSMEKAFSQYLRLSWEDMKSSHHYMESLNGSLGTSDWMRWHAPEVSAENTEMITLGSCLRAAARFCTAAGRFAPLRYYGCGMIELEGQHIDQVTAVGETVLSDEDLSSVVYSSILLLLGHTRDKALDNIRRKGLGAAFRSTLCAGRVATNPKTTRSREINADDHRLIRAWCIKKVESQPKLLFLEDELLKDPEDLGPYDPSVVIPPSIHNAIELETSRRRFFITKSGYMGLGPAGMQVRDHVYILLGGNAPFILRQKSFSIVCDGGTPILLPSIYPSEEVCEMVGDAYVHGLMEGEAMEEWQELSKIRFEKKLDSTIFLM